MASGRYIRTYSSVVGPRFSRGSRGDAPERPRPQRRRLQATGAPLIETSYDNTKDKYLILGCPNIAAFGKLEDHCSNQSDRAAYLTPNMFLIAAFWVAGILLVVRGVAGYR